MTQERFFKKDLLYLKSPAFYPQKQKEVKEHPEMKQNCGKSSLFYILLRRHILLDIESFLFLYLYRFGGGFYYMY